jgi:uncharacterized integral membrane protein
MRYDPSVSVAFVNDSRAPQELESKSSAFFSSKHRFAKETHYVDGNEMSANKQVVESEGAKPRDHAQPRHYGWKHAHRDWRVWIAVILMLALILVYVMTNRLSLRPGERASQPTPAANVP